MQIDTGKTTSGLDYLRQQVTNVLTTPIGSLVMRRDYGSRLFELIDAPVNRSTLVSIYAESADAIARWIPEYALQRVTASSVDAGRVVLSITGVYRPDGENVQLDGVVIQ